MLESYHIKTNYARTHKMILLFTIFTVLLADFNDQEGKPDFETSISILKYLLRIINENYLQSL